MRLLGGSNIGRVITWMLPLFLTAAMGLGQGSVVVEVVPGASIQTAIDAAPEGATVFVRSGLYEENLLIWKRLILASDEGAVIDGGGGEAAVSIRADGVTLRGFRIQGARVGVLVDGANGVRLERNTITGNTLAGVHMRGCSGNELYRNHVYKNAEGGSLPGSGYGVWLDSAHGNRIQWNHVAMNGRAGVYLGDSYRNMLSRNTLWDNAPGWTDNVDVGCLAAVGGIVLVRSDENLLEDNTVAGNSPYGIELLWSSTNRLVRNRVEPSLREADPTQLLAGIAVQGRGDYCSRGPYATDNAIVGNVIRGYAAGIWLTNTWANMIQGNTSSENRAGAVVSWWFGIPPDEGYGSIVPNRVQHNTFMENAVGIGIMDGEGLAVPHLAQIERNNTARNREAGLEWIGWRQEEAVVSARWNWWGDASGPHHPELNPQGKGNPVTDGVEFSPWLETSAHLTPQERLEVQTLAFYSCTALAASPDGRYLALATQGGSSLYLVDASSWELLRALDPDTREVVAVAFSLDGATLVSAGSDGRVSVHDTASGRRLRSTLLPGMEAMVVAFTSTGQILVLGESRMGASTEVTVWEVSSRDERHLSATDAPLLTTAFSADGALIALGFRDGTVKLCQAGTGKEVWTVRLDGDPVRALAFSPDGTVLAISGAEDGSVEVWHVAEPRQVATLGGDPRSAASALAFSPDGRSLACGGRTVASIWDWERGEILCTFDAYAGALAWSADGRFLVVGGDTDAILVGDASTGEVVHVLKGYYADEPAVTLAGHTEGAACVAFSPSGSVLAVGSGDGTVRLWNPGTGEIIASLAGHGEFTARVVWSPDGELLASAHWSSAGSGEGNVVRVWHVATRALAREFAAHETASYALAFSPDGEALAVGQWGEFVVWSLATGKEILHLRDHEGFVVSLEWDAGRSVLASVSFDGELKFWSWPEGELLRTVAVGSWHPGITCASWGTDWALLAVGDMGGSITLRDPETGGRIGEHLHRWYRSSLLSVAWGPDGRVLASGDIDGRAILWDPLRERDLAIIGGRTAGAVYSVAWSSDGRWLATAHGDGTVKLWDVDQVFGRRQE